MLPKEFRLKKRIAFNATYRTGLSFHKDGITVFCGKKKKEDFPTKIGFVVSKKTHKSAVKRNRLKRLIRESYRLLLKENNVGISNQAMSLIFVGQKPALEKEFKEIQEIVKYLLERVNFGLSSIS